MIRARILIPLALALVLVAAAAPAANATHNNRGTIKVHDDAVETPATRNVPHVGCDFFIEGFGMSDDSGTLVFFGWPPTGDMTVVIPDGAGLTWSADSGNVSGEFHFLAGPFSLPTGHYRVEVYTDDGHTGADTDHFAKAKMFWVECETTPIVNPPCPPGLVAAALDGGQVTLSWTAVAGAEAYLVYRAVGEADFELLDIVNGTTYLDTELEGGVSYSYYVTTLVGNLESIGCQQVTVTAIPFFPTMMVGALALAGSLGAFVLLRRRL